MTSALRNDERKLVAGTFTCRSASNRRACVVVTERSEKGEVTLPKSHLTILFDSPDLVAVDKPAGLAAIPGRAETTSLIEELAKQIGLPAKGSADPRVRVVHRLDKDTSGVTLFAKNIEAQRFLSHQFQNNTVAKEYLALVAGRPRENEGEIDEPLAANPKDPKRMSVQKRGRPARTRWVVDKHFRAATLLRCFPLTGKTHQIRVHLMHIGYPLLIDPLYNFTRQESLMLSSFKRDYRPGAGEERPLIARLTLHAHRLTFDLPGGERKTIESPPPKDFRAAVSQLTRHG